MRTHAAIMPSMRATRWRVARQGIYGRLAGYETGNFLTQLRAVAPGSAEDRAAAINATARSVFIIGRLTEAGQSFEPLPLLEDTDETYRKLYDPNLSVLLAQADLALARCLNALGRAREAPRSAKRCKGYFGKLGAHWRRYLASSVR